MTSLIQKNGLPSVEAMEALDEIIKELAETADKLDATTSWTSFGQVDELGYNNSGYRLMSNARQEIISVAGGLRTIHQRFAIREVPPAEPKREVVRV